MKRTVFVCVAALAASAGANAATVTVGDSTTTWLGFMNVSELPSNGGGYVFGSPWAPPDLAATFNDGSHTLTLSPNSINDPNPFWYTPAGGPGSSGNKIMEANLYVETTDVYNGQTVTFTGTVLSNSFTSAHVATIFIRDFAFDYSSLNQTTIPLTAGAFSLSLATDPGAGRHVQWGFQVKGVDVWITDTAPFGNAVITTVPQPSSIALIGLSGLIGVRRRRHA